MPRYIDGRFLLPFLFCSDCTKPQSLPKHNGMKLARSYSGKGIVLGFGGSYDETG
jgi:hypothetical protein